MPTARSCAKATALAGSSAAAPRPSGRPRYDVKLTRRNQRGAPEPQTTPGTPQPARPARGSRRSPADTEDSTVPATGCFRLEKGWTGNERETGTSKRPHLADAASRRRETQSTVRGNSGPRNTPRERPHPTLARQLRSAVLCPRPPCPDRRPCPTRHLLQGQAESHRLREILEPSLPDPRRDGCSSLSLWLSGGLACTATKGPTQSPCRDGSFPALRPPPSARPQIAHLCAFPYPLPRILTRG